VIGCGVRPTLPEGVEFWPLQAGRDGIAPADIVAALAQAGLRRILVEGGAGTISRFMDAGCLDRLHVLVAPMILGSGRPGLDLAPKPRLDAAHRPRTGVVVFPDGDVLFDCDLRS
jgi:diaminohydroxyphosphoribosylaminopyrimidine deaminase/5-amino-6-(5-phosphoribosylamino)uracil reductase